MPLEKTKSTAGKSGEGVRAVGRALAILKAFSSGDGALAASELAGRVDLSLPTLYRLLYTLQDSGFIISSGEPQRFRLGPAVAHLARAWSGSLDLGEVADPLLRKIWHRTDETVALFVREGDYRVCIAELPSPHALCFKRGVGYREPLVHGASGHAILANAGMSRDELIQYLRSVNAAVDLNRYADGLETVRQRGYAVSREEVLKGVVSVAAPFFNKLGQVDGALVVFGPSARLTEALIETHADLLVKKAALLSGLLAGV